MAGVPFLSPKGSIVGPVVRGWWSRSVSGARVAIFATCLGLVAVGHIAFNFHRDRSVSYTRGIHPDFVGRLSYLNELEKILLKRNPGFPSTAVLWGEAGIGKSEMAIAFANFYKNNFSIAFWIETGSEDKYRQSYIDLAEKLKIPYDPQEPTEGICDRVHTGLQKWSSSKPWLLVYDDVKGHINLPQRGNGAILLTTRDNECWDPSLCLRVLPFAKSEAFDLVKKITGYSAGKEWEPLFEGLGYSPFAVNLATHYIACTPNMSVTDYLSLTRESKEMLLESWSNKLLDSGAPMRLGVRAFQKANSYRYQLLQHKSALRLKIGS